jgi:hypothetical protein
MRQPLCRCIRISPSYDDTNWKSGIDGTYVATGHSIWGMLNALESHPATTAITTKQSCEPPRAQPAASLIAVSKLFASKAGILWIRPRRWVEYQTENASIASGVGASTMSTKS